MSIPADYLERVYAGVLGKLIGVYLGRPFEGWSYERIMAELGEIEGYVHERFVVPLVVTDDDISGTFTFLRALPDYQYAAALTSAQIGRAWLNYIIERRSILWWGGFGNSTEHTAYLRLKHGVAAPESGSIARNGALVAEQIGAQIFIDGWAMVAPGDPERAADLAGRASRVSHDGEAVYGAQALAAMEALAFVEGDIPTLLDAAVHVIPADSIIARLYQDLRSWHAEEPDWHATRTRIAAHYGYDRYGGNCHMVPNHALILLGLLYGDGDFNRSLRIVNTAGWDTDCNSGNLACLLGIRGGLAALECGVDWRGPIADRLYLPTADAGRAITDAVRETYHVVNSGRALAGEAPLTPKDGARFHFSLPGSTQGWQVEQDEAGATLENVPSPLQEGERVLALHYRLRDGQEARAATPTFSPPDGLAFTHYILDAAPTIYPGQIIHARLIAAEGNADPVRARVYVAAYGASDALYRVDGPEALLHPGRTETLSWRIPDTGGDPIAQVGLALDADGAVDGSVYLDLLTWDGVPAVTFTRPGHDGSAWRRAWADATDQGLTHGTEAFRIAQNEGTGLLITGSREWTDYTVSLTAVPQLAAAWGVAARVQGLRRYYALLLEPGAVRLVKVRDDAETTLAEAPLQWSFGEAYNLRLTVDGARLIAAVDGATFFAVDDDNPLQDGGIALVCREGCIGADAVVVEPAFS